MKKIGFIDIHPGGSISTFCIKQDESEKWQDNTLVYIFKENSGKIELEKTLEYSSDENLEDINDFYLSIPMELLNFRIINLPYSDKEKLGKAIPLELGSLIEGGDPEDIVFETVVLKNTDSGFDILVVYADKSCINAVIEKLSLKNIDPRIITSIDLANIIQMGEDTLFFVERLASKENKEEIDRTGSAANELFHPTINLRSGPLAYTKDIARRKRILKKTVVLSFLLAFIINANIVINLTITNKDISSQKKSLRNMYAALFPEEKKIVNEVYQLKSHIKEMKKKSDALTGVNPIDFLLKLSQEQIGGVIYNEIWFEKEFIKMKAEAVSMEVVDKARGKYSKYLSDVLITDIKPATDGNVFFTVVAKERPE
ncbi:MAG: hypothetical protein KKC46_04505 [Proteobacteria bacterium]|nr:hypothetical protein [Pseudomonadota bacterium]